MKKFSTTWRLGAAIFGSVIVLWSFSKPNSTSQKVSPNYVLNEAIDIQADCWEDHVGKHDKYTGQLVSWESKATRKIMVYGSVSLPFVPARVIDEAQHPSTYYTPSFIEFSEIDTNTDKPEFILHGVSSRGEDSQGEEHGYDSTCVASVVKRGKELANPLPNSSQEKP